MRDITNGCFPVFHLTLFRNKTMANEIINELIKSGAIMIGSFFAQMQADYPRLYEVSKQLKKEITDRTQEKYINGIHNEKTCDCVDCVDAREMSQSFRWA
jgi:hypothetical protein